ncbi:PQQ-dependent sugar dehydrogenase [Microbacterium hominis]|uniref:PQQ-dependent sugar dehydrogenase n=1 Tax=Microbacterium hominis TaxID=162426 RepID=A0A7D4QIE8_9MICO|nr:PQQ-dependent sugar dehydrogenase [Microbacterium hominis]QKJ19376.1 PQQ-dependent sugar dehydrogenase [Microbacterium hominis]
MTGGTRAAALAAAAAVALLITGCAGSGPGPAPTVSGRPTAASSPSVAPGKEASSFWRPASDPIALASGLDTPWSVVALAGGGALISERDTGVIVELTAEGESREAGVVPGVVSGGESGLHGIALRAAGGTDWLYAYHGAAGDNRVVRAPLNGARGALALGGFEPVITGIPRASTHNGGRIAFGPDDCLYVTTGDAQDRDAPQDPDSLGGKILRATPEGEPAPGNPFGSLVYSRGHRNVQGIAWTDDGRMWASEFGQNTWDELNLITPGGDYGWPTVEGPSEDPRFIAPVAAWPTDQASPSGIAAVGGTVFVAGLRGERLWAVDTAEGRMVGEPAPALAGQGRLRDVIRVGEGEIWVLTGNTDGRGSPRAEDDLLLRVSLAPEP